MWEKGLSARKMLLFLPAWRELFAGLARKQPCAFLFCGIACGSLPLLLFGLNAGMSLDVCLLIPIPFLIVASFVMPLRDAVWKFSLPVLAGACCALWTVHTLRGDPLFLELGYRPAGAQVMVQVDDPSCTGTDIPWLPPPKNIQCRVTAFRYSPADEWKSVSGLMMVRTGNGDVPFSPGYGDEYELDGAFLLPRKSEIEGAFDYPRYLQRWGIVYVFRADGWKKLADGTGFHRDLFTLRDSVLNRVVGDFRTEDARGVAAGLLFGFRQGIGSHTRREFIESGAIHILTVSGTHVGLFALVLFLLLRFLPYRIRFLCVPVLTFFYAMSTGMQVPAFRAFLMLSVYCLSRAFLHKVSAFNSLMLAGVVLLLWNPLNLLDPGFQFSFLTVSVLLLSHHCFLFWMNDLNWTRNWVPGRYRTWRMWIRDWFVRKLFGTLFAVVVAWLASTSLALLYQGVFPGAAILANLLLIPIAGCCFLLFDGALLALWICPGLLIYFTGWMELLIQLLQEICRSFSSLGVSYLPHAPLWSVFLFPVCLLFVLFSRRLRTALIGVIGICCVFLYWNFRAFFFLPEVMIGSGGGNSEPWVVFTLPRSRRAVVVNTPDFSSASMISDYLKSRGIVRIDSLILSGGRQDHAGGILYLAPEIRLKQLVTPFPHAGASVLRQVLAEMTALQVPVRYFQRGMDDGEWRVETWNCKSILKKEELELEITSFESKLLLRLKKNEDGTTRLTLFRNGGRLLLRRELAPSSALNVVFCSDQTESEIP